MKKWILGIGIVVVLFIGGYLLLSFFAVKVIQSQIQKAVGPGFTLREVKVKPTHLSVKGLHYEGLATKKRYLQIEELRLYPAVLSFLKGPLRIRECSALKPSFFFYRTREGVLIGPWGLEKKEKREGGEEKKPGERESVSIRIDRFRIRKGAVDFEDMKMGEPPTQIRLRDLDLEIKDIQYPLRSARSPVELKGKMKGKGTDGELYVKGWMNFETSELETFFRAREIEVKTFEPYYRKRVSAEVESGYMDMDATIEVKERRVNAPGHLILNDLRIKEGEGTVFWIPAKTLISILKDKGNRIQVKFHVKGNMDDPRFSLREAILVRIGISLAQAIGVPVIGAGEALFKGAGKGTEELTEGLKTLEELFKKKEKK
jgi:hypothetical protein